MKDKQNIIVQILRINMAAQKLAESANIAYFLEPHAPGAAEWHLKEAQKHWDKLMRNAQPIELMRSLQRLNEESAA